MESLAVGRAINVKIILSRKGFDSGYGGVPSPVLPGGRIVSLPIPSKAGLPARMCYANELCLGDVVQDLTGGRLNRDDSMHLDPDLGRSSLARKPGWRPAFGQVGAAQSHLSNQGVTVGDLFLFFGWFQQVELQKSHWKFVSNSKDFHSLFGWLQVGEIVDVDATAVQEMPAWLADHPHIAHRSSFAGQRNTIYLASDRLSFDPKCQSLPGGGMFEHWTPDLKLTAEGQSKSVWNVPSWLEPSAGRPALTYHGNAERWTRHANGLTLQTVAKGQEFVLNANFYPESINWARQLIERHV